MAPAKRGIAHRPLDRVGIVPNDVEQNERRAAGLSIAAFPVAQGCQLEAEAATELSLREMQSPAQPANVEVAGWFHDLVGSDRRCFLNGSNNVAVDARPQFLRAWLRGLFSRSCWACRELCQAKRDIESTLFEKLAQWITWAT